MVKAQNMVQGTAGLSSILNARNNKKATKYIAEQNRKIAEMQFEYNRKEISRAFDSNLRSILREYANERSGAVSEARTMLANINMNTGNNANVESESFEHDVKDKAVKDIADNMVFMLDTQKLGIEELTNTRVAQTYNLGLNYENALSSINNKVIAANNYFNQKMASGVMDIATAGFGLFGNSGLGQETSAESDSTGSNGLSFQEYDKDYISRSLGNFGIASYDPYKRNYSF